ncbi:endonuclease [Altererythrobacter xixiisoli]|uniref:Endonuclease n=1 Tax=Croceibacterium xixiisoli TaxID=1476466 RepID=A0A6I4TVA0_9SPHN|nr:endonuclease/exonuclease/phosphatase family protein [Croceibacterium xixiisoli]MXP00136.1 endonuclease [Croceibacterium xixiisoli]
MADPVELTFASYNIHKAVGRDGRRDPDRIMAVLGELDADVVALQEADMRFGSRTAVLPRALLAEHHWQAAPLAMRPAGIGWHGNTILVRSGLDIIDVAPIALPALEPRGAVRATLSKDGVRFSVVGMHLDLSGLLRRRQVQTVCSVLRDADHASVLMGDFNEWSVRGGALTGFHADWRQLLPGRSFPSRRPIAQLDRIVHSRHWHAIACSVHHSPLSSMASDHLPVIARLALPA